MSYLVDTNVLLRSVQKSHPMESEAANSIELLIRHREILVITPQNLIEFWCVATRPEGVRLSIMMSRGLPGAAPGTAVYAARYRLSAACSAAASSVRVQRKRGEMSQ